MNIYSFSVLCFSFGVLMTAILVLVKRKDQIAIRFTAFSISVCSWGFLFSLWITQNLSPETTLLLIRVSYFFVLFIPVTWIHFVFDFIGKKEPFKYFYLLNYLLALSLMPFCMTPLIFKGLYPYIVGGLKYAPQPGLLHHYHYAHFLILVPYGLWSLIQAYLNAHGEVKRKLKFLVLGTLIGFTAGGGTYLFFYKVVFPLQFVVLMPIYPILTSIALLRYGLFDEEHLIAAFQREKLMAIGTMAASLNHELRNPFYIAKGKIETCLDSAERGRHQLDEKNKEIFSSVLSQLNRASDIMQKFSDFAKPFHKDTKKEKVIVREAFENVLQLVSAEFELNKIQVEVVPTNGLIVYANSRHFEEVLFNLMINACHALQDAGCKTRDAKSRLSKITLNAYQPNGKVIVEVADTGPGISRDLQSKIFQPFYSTKGANGSGLGLYITKQLVERNGGKISVKSKPGQGTTFKLELLHA